tara:strand:- start:1927 stop:2664 length:738 start_codon:yes stop_codon:yes gene_type:complete
MKKYFLIVLVIAFTAEINAQNNLVFNQVLDFKLDSGMSATVPQGKVWKVEFVKGAQLTASKENVSYGVALNQTNFGNPGLNQNAPWFSEGTVLSPTTSGCGLSILEFNVVPISESSSSSGGGFSSEGLEFNKVINYTITTTVNSYGEIVDNIVIPEGKVWKITSVSLLETSNSYPNRLEDVSSVGATLGGIMIFYRPGTSGYSTSSYDNFPIWINSGTKDLMIGRPTPSGPRYKLSISAIEYNIP